MGCTVFVVSIHFGFFYYTFLQQMMALCSHPYRVRSYSYGFSHGLNKCPLDTCLPSLRSGRPFESRCISKKKDTQRVSFFLLLVYTLDVVISIMHIRPHPYGCVRMHMDSPPA